MCGDPLPPLSDAVIRVAARRGVLPREVHRSASVEPCEGFLRGSRSHFRCHPVLRKRSGENTNQPFAGPFVSGPGWVRTNDLGIKSPLLYRLSYRPAGAQCRRRRPRSRRPAVPGGFGRPYCRVGKGYAEGSAVEERQAALERGDDPTPGPMPVAPPSTAARTTSPSGTSSAGPTRSTPTRSSPPGRPGGSRSCAAAPA